MTATWYQGYGVEMRFTVEHGAIGGTWLTGFGPASLGLIALFPNQRERMVNLDYAAEKGRK